MIRKRDRVIGTLAIWLGILVVLGMILDRMNGIAFSMLHTWYHAGNVVTGASPEEATRILEAFQALNNDLFIQVRQFTQAEMLAYLPYFVVLAIILLAGGVLSTMFIWRSVAVPTQISEAITAHRAADEEQPTNQSLASLLDDDGEIRDADPDYQTTKNYQQESL